MLMSYVSILLFCLVDMLTARSRIDRNRSTILPSNQTSEGESEEDEQLLLEASVSKPCEGDECLPPAPNLVGPIVGSLCGILVLALIGVFLVWFYFKRKHQKTKKVPITTPAINYIEEPPLYTGAISTIDISSRLYGMSRSRNDSIDSHLYEKINYSEAS